MAEIKEWLKEKEIKRIKVRLLLLYYQTDGQKKMFAPKKWLSQPIAVGLTSCLPQGL